MMMYFAELIFLAELFVFGLGVILLHRGSKDMSKILKIGGYIVIVGSALTAACTAYYSIKYLRQGAFETAFLMNNSMPSQPLKHHYYYKGSPTEVNPGDDIEPGDMVHPFPRDD